MAKLVTVLETSLGTKLFERSVRGLVLTADGQGYLEACRPILEQLAIADEAVGSAGGRPRGTLVVGASMQLVQHCILPGLPQFRARFPDIVIDLRVVDRPTPGEASGVDVFVLLTCASPAYWALHGMPRRPDELAGHACMIYRNPANIAVDLWNYARGTTVSTDAHQRY